MNILHISFKKSNRNNLFNNLLEERNIIVTEYDFFNSYDYEALVNDNYEYDALVLGSQGGGSAAEDGLSRKGLCGFNYINLYNAKGRDEEKHRLFKLIQKYANIPILGICYGAQILNIFYGGSISEKRDIKKTGYKSIQLDTSSPLFKGLPSDIDVEFNTWYPNVPSPLSNIIAVTKKDNAVAAQSFPNNRYSLYFHIVHGETILHKVIDNFINIVEREKNHIAIMKVSILGLLFGLYVMFT